ncbi:hypothetical protein P691DRAFT_839249 [Macrolepiota fuliginosa MF-IS2]|uniref:C2H2-type domain-containing protein n=1 Tax=Macrolepiota fuliginosa MF-IS2 TaxID=1400762 RepID=A0A9P5X747_9AGAR|nr:hypothetical protein P691DRAFT_839249 [Macrolepiota fuliginosa MF-IS2]
MVSFQCHNCGDVVKKPKLDQHHSRCHGGFDCIDCSTTFNTPAEYKSHTSCISEAEKYQKSVYKGPRNVCRYSQSSPFSRSLVQFVCRDSKMVVTIMDTTNKMVAQEADTRTKMGEVGIPMEDVEDHNGTNRELAQQVLMIPPLGRLRGCRP